MKPLRTFGVISSPIQDFGTISRTTMSTVTTTSPWHAMYPAPRQSSPATIDRQQVLELLRSDVGTVKKDYVLVDVRRNDHEVSTLSLRSGINHEHSLLQGGTIRGSINLPAQSLHPTIPTLYALFKTAGLEKVIWYCCKFHSSRTLRTVVMLMYDYNSVFPWARYSGCQLVQRLYRRPGRREDEESSSC